jgi:TctA family transporter
MIKYIIVSIAFIIVSGLIVYKNSITNFAKMVLLDTLIKDGKICKKSLQMLVSFILATIIGFIIVYHKEVNPYAIQVFWGFLLISSGMAMLTVYDKIKGNSNTNNP